MSAVRRGLGSVRRIASVVIVVALVLRVTLWLGLLPLLRHLADRQGLALRCADIDLTLFGGHIDVWHLEVAPRDERGVAGAADLAVEYATLDIDVSALLYGELVVHRVEVDGVEVTVTRNAEGRWRVGSLWREAGGATAADDNATTAPFRPGRIDFDVPLRIDAIRLQHAQVHFTDALAQPPLATTIDLSLRVSDVGSASRPTRVDLTVAAEGVVDSLHLFARGTAAGARLDAHAGLRVAALRGERIAPLLRSLGLEVSSALLDAGLDLDVRTAPSANDADALAIDGDIARLYLRHDGQTQLSIEAAQVNLPSLGARQLTGVELEVSGMHAALARTASGDLRIGGITLRASDAAAPVADPPAVEPFRLGIVGVVLRDSRIDWRDAAMASPVDIAVRVDALSAGPLAIGGPRDAAPIALSAALHAPGVLRDLSLRAELAPFAQPRALQVDLAIDDASLAGIEPYLAAIGWRSTLRSARLRLHGEATQARDADGVSRWSARVHDVLLADGDTEHLRIDDGDLGELRHDPTIALWRVESLRLAGTRFAMHVHDDGALELLGGRSIEAEDRAAEATGEPAEEPGPPTRFELRQLDWTRGAFAYTQDGLAHPLAIAVEDCDIALTDLALGGAPEGTNALPRTRVAVALRAPALCERLRLDGTFAAAAGAGIDLEVALQAEGVDPTSIAGWIAEGGVAIDGVDASLDLVASANWHREGEVTIGSGAIDRLSIRQGDVEVAGLASARVDGLRLAPGGTRVDAMVLEQPRLRASRDADGGLRCGGLRPLTTPGEAVASLPEAPDTAAGRVFAIGTFAMNDARVAWQDARVDPPVDTTLVATLSVENLDTAPDAQLPARIRVDAAIDGVLQRMQVEGQASLQGATRTARLTIDAAGMHPAPLAGYLGGADAIRLADGSLRATLEAHTQPAAEGGSAAEFSASDVVFKDGERALLELARLHLRVARIDRQAAVLIVDELVSSGLRVAASRDADGRLEILGLVPGATPAELDAAGEANAAPPLIVPLIGVGVGVSPRVSIGHVDLGVERLSWPAGSGHDAVDLSLRLSNTAPSLLLAADRAQAEPLHLRLTGRAAPLIESIDVDLATALFGATPRCDLTWRLTGIDGPALLRAVAGASSSVGAAEIHNGEFTGRASAALHARMPTAFSIDRSAPIGGELRLEEIALRGHPDGPVLLGLQALRVDVGDYRPDTGDLLIDEIDLTRPQGAVRLERDRLVAFGLAFPRAVEGEAPADPVAVATSGDPAGSSGPEIRIDRLFAQEADLELRDDSVDPPLVLPINGLDVQVDGFTTRGFREPRPIDFRVLVQAGDIELLKHAGNDNLLLDLASAATSTAQRLLLRRDRDRLQQRPAFEEIAASGRLVLAPELSGWTRIRARGLELQNLRGLLEQRGVVVGDGVLDTTLDLRLDPQGGLSIQNDNVLSHLALTEREGGPIGRLLRLTAPVDVVTFILKDQRGDVRLPLRLEVPPQGMSRGAVIETVVAALARLIGDAVAASPFRAIGTVTDLVRLLPNPFQAPADLTPVEVTFAPAATAVEAAQQARLDEVARDLARVPSLRVVIEQEAGQDDLPVLERLANPSAALCRALADRLEHRLRELAGRRQQQATEARIRQLAGATGDADDTRRRLAELDMQIATTDTALEQALELLGPHAARSRDRRIRDAALEIGALRAFAVRDAILRGAGADVRARIEVRRPIFDDAPRSPRGVVRVWRLDAQGR